jgi:hypothetical protein
MIDASPLFLKDVAVYNLPICKRISAIPELIPSIQFWNGIGEFKSCHEYALIPILALPIPAAPPHS